MSFSIFTFCFITGSALLFHILPRVTRPYVLLALSYAFLIHLSGLAAASVAVVTVCAYLSGLFIEYSASKGRINTAKAAAGAMIVIALAVMLFIKFVPTYLTFTDHVYSRTDKMLVALLLPIGYSYYIFQVISYLVDIVRGKIKAERNPFHFALFLAYFPKFISGPIMRADELLPQIKDLKKVNIWDKNRVAAALCYLSYGYFLKLMVADRAAPFTTSLLDNPGGFSSHMLIWNAFLYTIQLYSDFAGYTAIAIGTSHLFGITLLPNFDAPYISASVTEFWRRWHMSLSRFLRDYLYIPLGGNRKGLFRKCLNTVIVFVVCGIWHGSGARFVLWGLMHGIILVIESLLPGRKKALSEGGIDIPGLIISIPKRLITFILVGFAWIPFGATSTKGAIEYIRLMFTSFESDYKTEFIGEMEYLQMSALEMRIFLYALIAVFVTDLITYIRKKPFADTLCDLPYPLRYVYYLAVILVIMVFGVYGPGFDVSAFMYMNF